MEETWKSGEQYPNRYDRVCKDCGMKIPNGSRDYFYRKTPGGDYESMCLGCMNKIPKAPEAPAWDLGLIIEDQLMILNETLVAIRKCLESQGAH